MTYVKYTDLEWHASRSNLQKVRAWLTHFINTKTVNYIDEGLCQNIEMDIDVSVSRLIYELTGSPYCIEKSAKGYDKNCRKYKGVWLEARLTLAQELINWIDDVRSE